MPPQVFGRYLLEELLAVGGMGEVFLATDTGSPGADPAYRRPCVVKRILPSLLDNKDMVAMFAREATLGALLSHHAITQLLDHGVVDGRHYMALEYVRGCNLKTLLDAHRGRGSKLPIPDVTHVFTHVALALDHAHRAKAPDGSPLQLVHRDVSPHNVLLSVDGEVKLTDFGMARGAAMRGVYQTQETMLKGKMAYLSPEQASGQQVDARSDVFALGVVLFEMLTLQHPFMHDGVGGVALLDRIRRASFPSPRELRPDAPQWMLDVVQRCLVAEPNDRVPSALAVLDVIREGAPIHQAQASLSAHLRRMGLPPSKDTAPRTQEAAAPVVVKTQEAVKPLHTPSPEEAWHNTPPRVSDEELDLRASRPAWIPGALVGAALVGAGVMYLLTSSVNAPTGDPVPLFVKDAGEPLRATPVKTVEKKKPRGKLKDVVNADAMLDALPHDDVDAGVPDAG